jgi:CRP/FNR family cyclic AMP-dependent transcriptional regulator
MKMHHHDALALLPRTPVLCFPKRCAIYGHTGSPSRLYLVLAGSVKLNCTATDGTQSMIRIVPPEGFFGESALVPQYEPLRETALAIAPTQVMSWTAEEVEVHIERQPRLALALCEYFGHCNEQMRERIVTVATQKTGTRVSVALIQLAREIGEARTDGACRVNGLTHQVLAEYIGTSREIVTCEMNRLRTQGYVQYCRRYIDVYADAMAENIRISGLNLGQTATAPTLRAAG